MKEGYSHLSLRIPTVLKDSIIEAAESLQVPSPALMRYALRKIVESSIENPDKAELRKNVILVDAGIEEE